MSDLWSRYSSKFSVKLEDASTCVGLELQQKLDGTTAIAQLFPSSPDMRYQHFLSSKPFGKRIQVILSQLCSICDRGLGSDVIETIRRSFACFHFVGFQADHLRRGSENFLRCHPYLFHQVSSALRQLFPGIVVGKTLKQHPTSIPRRLTSRETPAAPERGWFVNSRAALQAR